MVPGKWTALFFLLIGAIFSDTTGTYLDEKDEKVEFIAQNFDFKDDLEITADFCSEVCGEEYGVVCSGDKNKITCTCEDANEVFDKTDKECKEVTVDFCYDVCGGKNGVVCIGDKTDKYKINCTCEDDNELFDETDKECKEKCYDDDDCLNEGICLGAEDLKLCKCQNGTTGNMCDVITDCETGRLQKCKEERGECVYEFGNATCSCPDGKEFYNELGYCEMNCTDDDDCEGYNNKCNDDGLCVCEEGYEGEDCSVVTGCKDLEEKCLSISTECVHDRYSTEKAICKCKNRYIYDRQNNLCQASYCYPTNPCKGSGCKYDDSIGTGYCVCSGEKYYNYRTEKCEDLPDKCLLKKTPCDKNEICVNGICKCKHQIKEGEECKPNFCSPNPCFPNSKCSEDDSTCHCEEGKYYNGFSRKCEDKICSFKEFKTDCPCPSGMSRNNDSKECVPSEDEELCSKDCGYGFCVKKNNTESCRCFSSIADHNYIAVEKCILKRTFCAGGFLGYGLMKCDCSGQYTQADDGITCRLKTCKDENVKEVCASIGGECKMKWNSNWNDRNIGYYCECPAGYRIGDNGKCTDICSLDEAIRLCAKKDAFCYNSVSNRNNLTGTCSCPPTLKMVNDRCLEEADHVYIIRNIPVLKKRYEIKSGINKALLSADLIRSMEQTFDVFLFKYGYLYDYRIEDDVIECSVWIKFGRYPSINELDKTKLVPKKFSNVCDDCDENAIVWPPSLLLGERGLQNVTIDSLKFCSPEVTNIICGKGTSCQYKVCTCQVGFKVIEYSIREIANFQILRCEDIDECALNIHMCSENTTCVNTVGDYKCVCKEGYKKKDTFQEPETDKTDCFDMCTPSPCLKGKCNIKGKSFDCKCDSGFAGSVCDRIDDNYLSSKIKTFVVGSVLGFLLFVLVSAFLYYVIKTKKRQQSGDFAPSSRRNLNEMAERSHM